ncbi:MAG TPA: YbhB/YbcL family Raf kinase inhibitor-like protein [Candidatus Binatia bacterium]|nr:YbhB/YbcL family Raf kinase inhibitor-like protein [Candidatus Binatia bacterium]
MRAALAAAVLGVVFGGVAMAFELKSPAFAAGKAIPQKHGCDGADVSPPLAWTAAPAGTKSFALVCADPDAPAGTWVHWVIWNLPPTVAGLPEGVPSGPTRDDGSRQGINDFEKIGWGGPCPPPGRGAHRYFFKLQALDAVLPLAPGATKAALEKAMEGHVIGRAELIGRYER